MRESNKQRYKQPNGMYIDKCKQLGNDIEAWQMAQIVGGSPAFAFSA